MGFCNASLFQSDNIIISINRSSFCAWISHKPTQVLRGSTGKPLQWNVKRVFSLHRPPILTPFCPHFPHVHPFPPTGVPHRGGNGGGENTWSEGSRSCEHLPQWSDISRNSPTSILKIYENWGQVTISLVHLNSQISRHIFGGTRIQGYLGFPHFVLYLRGRWMDPVTK